MSVEMARFGMRGSRNDASHTSCLRLTCVADLGGCHFNGHQLHKKILAGQTFDLGYFSNLKAITSLVFIMLPTEEGGGAYCFWFAGPVGVSVW